MAIDDCRVCGRLEATIHKVCKSCREKYEDKYDLSTPDGRYEAKREERGVYKISYCHICFSDALGEKACPKCIAKYGKKYDLTTNKGIELVKQEKRDKESKKWEAARVQMVDKVNRAKAAIDNHDYREAAKELKGIERISKKVTNP